MNPQPKPPAFTAEVERAPDAAIVHCRGLLVAGQTEAFQDTVKPLLQTNRRVVLDFTDLTRLDSMGLGTIVALAVSAKRTGCQFELVNLGKQIKQLFSITNLLSLFEPAGDNTFRIV